MRNLPFIPLDSSSREKYLRSIKMVVALMMSQNPLGDHRIDDFFLSLLKGPQKSNVEQILMILSTREGEGKTTDLNLLTHSIAHILYFSRLIIFRKVIEGGNLNEFLDLIDKRLETSFNLISIMIIIFSSKNFEFSELFLDLDL